MAMASHYVSKGHPLPKSRGYADNALATTWLQHGSSLLPQSRSGGAWHPTHGGRTRTPVTWPALPGRWYYRAHPFLGYAGGAHRSAWLDALSGQLPVVA